MPNTTNTENQQRSGCLRGGEKGTLTLAGSFIINGLVASLAGASSNGHHPLPLSIAVQPNTWRPSRACLFSIWYTCPWWLHQWGPLPSSKSFREGGKSFHHSWAFVEKDLDCHQGHAGSWVLEGQIEAMLGEWPKATYFNIHLYHLPSAVHLGKAFVSCNSIHFSPWALTPFWQFLRGYVSLWLVVVECESLLARRGYSAHAGTVSHWETEADMDSVGSASLYEVSTQPVILTWFSHIADFKGSDQAFLVIQDTYLIPL